MSTDRVIIFPGSNELTPEQEREIDRECRVFHAQAMAFTWRNISFIWMAAFVGLYVQVNKPWVFVWAVAHGYELSLIGSALMLLVFSWQAVRRNKRKAVSVGILIGSGVATGFLATRASHPPIGRPIMPAMPAPVTPVFGGVSFIGIGGPGVPVVISKGGAN